MIVRNCVSGKHYLRHIFIDMEHTKNEMGDEFHYLFIYPYFQAFIIKKMLINLPAFTNTACYCLTSCMKRQKIALFVANLL